MIGADSGALRTLSHAGRGTESHFYIFIFRSRKQDSVNFGHSNATRRHACRIKCMSLECSTSIIVHKALKFRPCMLTCKTQFHKYVMNEKEKAGCLKGIQKSAQLTQPTRRGSLSTPIVHTRISRLSTQDHMHTRATRS